MSEESDGLPGKVQIFKKIIESISTDLSRLSIREEELREKCILCVDCSERDYSKLVGKRGLNVNALQVLFALASHRTEEKDGVVKISIPATTARSPKEPFVFNPKWDADALKAILIPLCELTASRGVVDVRSLTRETMLVKITVHGFDGETHQSATNRMPPITFESYERALGRVLVAIAKANGRDVELELNEYQTPDTSGR